MVTIKYISFKQAGITLNYNTSPALYKAQSNIELPKDSKRWVNGQLIYYFNHIDNGVQEEGREGQRYEAEVMIAKEEEDITSVLTKYYADTVLCEAIKDNIEVEGMKAIEVKKPYKLNAELSAKVDLAVSTISISPIDIEPIKESPIDIIK